MLSDWSHLDSVRTAGGVSASKCSRTAWKRGARFMGNGSIKPSFGTETFGETSGASYHATARKGEP